MEIAMLVGTATPMDAQDVGIVVRETKEQPIVEKLVQKDTE